MVVGVVSESPLTGTTDGSSSESAVLTLDSFVPSHEEYRDPEVIDDVPLLISSNWATTVERILQYLQYFRPDREPGHLDWFKIDLAEIGAQLKLFPDLTKKLEKATVDVEAAVQRAVAYAAVEAEEAKLRVYVDATSTTSRPGLVSHALVLYNALMMIQYLPVDHGSQGTALKLTKAVIAQVKGGAFNRIGLHMTKYESFLAIRDELEKGMDLDPLGCKLAVWHQANRIFIYMSRMLLLPARLLNGDSVAKRATAYSTAWTELFEIVKSSTCVKEGPKKQFIDELEGKLAGLWISYDDETKRVWSKDIYLTLTRLNSGRNRPAPY